MKCPNCQSTNHAKILWGLPANMREIEEEFMENCIMDESGTLPAKTIIFPVSIKHAKRIWEFY